MKNGRGNVYDDYDDKYDKLDQKRSFKTINRLIILGTRDVSITKDLDTTIIEHETTSNQIVDAFRHAWKGYSQDAFGKDEYQPLTHSGRNWIPGGIGLMMIDSLDTLMLMNLTKEYKEVRSWIATQLDFNKDQDVNVFETTIRVLGGLLSAYHLSNHDSLYLEKAVDLGDRLLQAFNTDSGIPYSGIKLSSGKPIGVGPSSTAEATTIQLEFKYLSHLTGDMKYWKAAEKVMERIHELVEGKGTGVIDGLVPIYIDAVSGNFVSGQIRLGSRGDSYYEYLLKQYLQTNKTEIKYRERYDHAIDGIKKHLIQYSYPNQYLYIAELLDSSKPKEIYPKMDHLVCFMGGSFVLGATEGKSLYDLDLLTNKRDREDFQLGQGITKTCYHMYNMTATGLASEIVYFNTNPNSESKEDIGIHKRDTHNLLRPETVESLFLLYRITGDEKYREWGWNIFESFEKHTKLPEGGYAALKDVTHIPAPMYNRMDTFYLAETLKYLYLLFSPNDIIPLGQYVFNTEAHPLPIFTP
ncbi:glycoside hydrolase family 47 protein [Cokeromyces recurvatus]|uniref:glycoside hydrolase family 47 protein n=1 Tax=Cokeromyces recurvatus TaxID=90255 RepID=UPI00221F949B|nr:glycoside hydrolase family 47 protein [Cokeromyces recurvatus]KAI7899066.1 glycoside hydrolase family 47 protein [Cokeromyces recurvatus]